MFSMQMSVCQQSILKVTSSVIVTRSGAFGWHNIFLWKLLQSDLFILLDQCIINFCYILHMFSQLSFFSCNLDLNSKHQPTSLCV